MSYHVMEFYILCHDYHGISSLYFVIEEDQYHFIMILLTPSIELETLPILIPIPYTWNFLQHVYFTVKHETRIFAVEISQMKVIQNFHVFRALLQGYVRKCMLLI